ncbi:activator-dependent family glycosyltransferase [Streptomyces kanamyceticus]|uniref:Activator-dependent family glycosyltransferase n=1 Tax=Streptomyces kanamyceticus TaxID=1967 RepID=A0A5J6GQ78_STRKN|nr:activator-dependent family glycosyltransferase [Streptomyces kanamyceticus]QEU96281.1 activator-dependent family glycosyltransferase [Streptomyces kanamyceticus]
MRVLFTPFPATTHVNTQVPLAWALRSAGHDVCVATQPDVCEDILGAGLTAVPIGEVLDVGAKMNQEEAASVDGSDPADEASTADEAQLDADDESWLDVLDIGERRPERLTYDYVHGTLTAWTHVIHQATNPRPVVAELVDFAEDWRPDLVIWDTMYYAGSVAAMATGAAHARLMFGLDLMGRMRARYRTLLSERPPVLREDPMEEWLGSLLAPYGREFAEEAVLGQWTVDPLPTALRLPVDHPYVPVRYVPYNGPSALPDWLREPPPRPRVCLTLGRSFREIVGGDKASVPALLDAVSDLDIEVVATLNADQLAELDGVPDNVRVVDFVPLDLLLPTCAAIIHHGGSGTVATALAHGVPQIMVPARMWCNIPKARRVAELGAGLCRPAEDFSAAELRTMLTRVLGEPSFARSAAALRTQTLAAPAPADLVPVLERLTAAHRGPRSHRTPR